MNGLILGVDGGNTKTVALVARENGTVVGAGRAGCGDIYGAGSVEAAVAEIRAAVTGALPSDATLLDISTAVFSLAGADWDEDKAELHAALSILLPRADIDVINDAIGALRVGTADGIGVSVVVGTGGCVGAGGPDGAEWHSSWWALHTGAWAIGTDALQAVYGAELGTVPATALTTAALETYAEPTVEAVLHSFTRRGGRSDWEAAHLAPAVLTVAHAGDPVAQALIATHGTRLGDVAAIAARRVGLVPPYPLVLLGGLLRGVGADALVDAIVARVPGAKLVRPGQEPVVGALLRALDRAGAPYDPERVDGTLPGPGLYATLPPPRGN